MKAAHLRVVDEHGELVEDGCPNCAGMETELRAWRSRYQALKRDKAKEAREHDLWPQAVELFNFWREQCKHPRSKWTADRFWIVQPMISEYGIDTCRKAIQGAAFDPYKTKRRNGTIKRYDDFNLIFRSADKLEEFCNRAPRLGPP